MYISLYDLRLAASALQEAEQQQEIMLQQQGLANAAAGRGAGWWRRSSSSTEGQRQHPRERPACLLNFAPYSGTWPQLR